MYRVLAISFPFLLFLLAEICVRSFYPYEPTKPQNLEGWGEGIRPAAGYVHPPLLIEQDNQVTISPELLPFMPSVSFPVHTDKKRIFCFGGSATLGVPFEKTPEKTFPQQLHQILLSAGEDVDVINLGGASFGSDHVLALGLEALSYSPSYLVIYSGNNEFFTHMINWETQNTQWVYQKQPSSHLIAHLREKISPASDLPSIHTQQQERWQNLFQGMLVTPEHIDEETHTRRDPIQQAVIERYIRNLTLLYQKAAAQQIPIIFAVVPSNLHTPPAISIHSPVQNRPKSWLSLLKKINPQDESCMTSLQELTEQNPWYAEAWYKRAQCAHYHQQPSQKWFEAARDLDMVPGRPNQALNDALLKSSLPLMLFDAKQEFFHDSCHLTEQGYFALAEQFSQLILSNWKFSSPSP